MFTGLIAEVGTVGSLTRGGNARLVVNAGGLSDGSSIGDSVSVNGVCLTVTSAVGGSLTFDVVRETLERTNIGDLHSGDLVNLERPLGAGQEFGGHFVLGHVDGTGRIVCLERRGDAAELEIAAGHDIMRYVVEKGSIAVDGISLTVARLLEGRFSVAVIPHTLESTNLRSRRAGDVVNLETDILGKYVERFMQTGLGAAGASGLTEDGLHDAGF